MEREDGNVRFVLVVLHLPEQVLQVLWVLALEELRQDVRKHGIGALLLEVSRSTKRYVHIVAVEYHLVGSETHLIGRLDDLLQVRLEHLYVVLVVHAQRELAGRALRHSHSVLRNLPADGQYTDGRLWPAVS